MADHLAGYGHGVEPLMWTTDEGQTFPVVAVEYALIDKDTLFCLDCEGRAGPSCADYHGHGVATLDELMDAYSNPAGAPPRQELTKEDR